MLAVFFWPLTAGAFMAGALASLGCHLAARDKAMQTLCIAQGASLGVLFGIGVIGDHHGQAYSAVPFAFGIAASLITFYLCEWVSRLSLPSTNSYFTVLFALLLAVGHFIAALFPNLESHLSQIFFGDLATLSNPQAQFVAVVAIAALFFQFVSRRATLNFSFEYALFPSHARSFHSLRWQTILLIPTMLLLCTSVQYLGVLFTLGTLFLPTVLIGLGRSLSLSQHLWLCPLIASSGTVMGFSLSVYLGNWPTVPSVILATALCATLVAAANRSQRDEPF